MSKQICSAGTQHFLNLFISLLISDQINDEEADSCTWYFINFLLDTTIGVGICSILMKICTYFAEKKNIKNLKNGYYFDTIERNGKEYYKLNIKMYLAQLVVWELVIIVNKIFMVGLNFSLKNLWIDIGDFVLKIFSKNKKIKLIMVMVIFPLIFNAFQFWIFDNLLKLDLDPESKLLEEALQSDLEIRQLLELDDSFEENNKKNVEILDDDTSNISDIK